MLRKICVFCGGRKGKNPAIERVVQQVGKMLAQQELSIVFGGSNRGLMGVVTDAALAHGGKVIGVLPDVLEGIETEHPNITKLIRTPCLATRKQKMMDIADAFLILPGGYGTLDELYEILVLRKIKTNFKPIFILNHQGFWNYTILQIQRLVQEGFVSAEEQTIFTIVKNTQELAASIEKINQKAVQIA